MRAQVIVLAGPSGAGKSRLAERLEARFGWPRLRLDDFYREGDEQGLPLITGGRNRGLVDWDHSASWNQTDAMTALTDLCHHGRTDVPIYDISSSSRTGAKTLDLGGAAVFTAEGIFAAEVVEASREAGMLVAAYCITQHPAVTFARRLQRDLREHRKPPPVLVRRGMALAHRQRAIVKRAAAVGCTVASGDAAYDEIAVRHAPTHEG